MNIFSVHSIIVKIGPKILRGSKANCKATLQISVTEDALIIHILLAGRNVSASTPLPPEVWKPVYHEIEDTIDAVRKTWPRPGCTMSLSITSQEGWPSLDLLLDRLRRKGVSIEERATSVVPDQIKIRLESVYLPHWGGGGHSSVASIDADGSVYLYKESASTKSLLLPTGYSLGSRYLIGKLEVDQLAPLANCISKRIWRIPTGLVGSVSSAGINDTTSVCIGPEEKIWENKHDWGAYSEAFGDLQSIMKALLHHFGKTFP